MCVFQQRAYLARRWSGVCAGIRHGYILCRAETTSFPPPGIRQTRQTLLTHAYAGIAVELQLLSGASDTYLNSGSLSSPSHDMDKHYRSSAVTGDDAAMGRRGDTAMQTQCRPRAARKHLDLGRADGERRFVSALRRRPRGFMSRQDARRRQRPGRNASTHNRHC